MSPNWLLLLFLAACEVGAAPPDQPDGSVDPQPSSVVLHSIAGGAFKPIAPYTNIAGRALMVRRLDGTTELSAQITGLMPATMYTTHLHAAPCQYAGGGHYKIDPAVASTLETNELWLKGTSSMSGALISDGSWQHATRGEALSVVIHDPASSAKMACADLLEDNVETVEFSGTLAPFAQAGAADMTVSGSIKATRTSAGTSFMLTLGGLDPTAVGYGTHIHAEPCAVTTGGGHYKLDPNVVDTIQANELWLNIASYAGGTATSTLQVPHVIRTDAQSIVLHRTITDLNKPKVACTDLTRMTARLPFETSGSAFPLTGPAVTGTAIMTRKLTNVTEVALVMTGLAPNAKYNAHIHNQACAVESGGGHFKFDRAINDATADNEVWFELATDAEGTAHDSTWVAKIANASATSLVVHAPDNARLTCFDLQ